MIVIGIDPGYDRLGVAIIQREAGLEKLIHSECIETDRTSPLSDRLYFLGQSFLSLVKKYQTDTLAIETLFFNKNQKTVMGVSQVRGVIIYLAQDHGCRIFEYGPQEIKIAITGYGKSDKKAMVDMVKRLLPDTPHSALDDEYDAIAVGLTCLAHNRIDR